VCRKAAKVVARGGIMTLIIKHGNGKYGRFIDELPIRDDDFPSLCMLVYWRVVSINSCGFTPRLAWVYWQVVGDVGSIHW